MSNLLEENVALEQKVKDMIIDRLGLDITTEEIEDDAPIFGMDDDGRGLDLDSVDALELVVGINEVFGIKHQSDDLSVLYSVKTISDFIRKMLGE